MKPCYGTFGGLDECITCPDAELCAVLSGDVTLESIESVMTRLTVTDYENADISDRIFSLYPDASSWRYRELIHLRLMGKTFKEIACVMQLTLRHVMRMMNDIDCRHPQIAFSLRRLTLWESSRMSKKPKVQS